MLVPLSDRLLPKYVYILVSLEGGLTNLIRCTPHSETLLAGGAFTIISCTMVQIPVRKEDNVLVMEPAHPRTCQRCSLERFVLDHVSRSGERLFVNVGTYPRRGRNKRYVRGSKCYAQPIGLTGRGVVLIRVGSDIVEWVLQSSKWSS